MRRYSMSRLEVARIPYGAHFDMMEAARLNEPTPADFDRHQNAARPTATRPKNDAQVAAFFRKR